MLGPCSGVTVLQLVVYSLRFRFYHGLPRNLADRLESGVLKDLLLLLKVILGIRRASYLHKMEPVHAMRNTTCRYAKDATSTLDTQASHEFIDHI